MFTLSSQLYDEIAARLREAVGRLNYFSGSIAFPFEGGDCKFTASLVIVRRSEELPEGETHRIVDMVPVWWEFSTVCDGAEVDNDFSFGELKEFLF